VQLFVSCARPDRLRVDSLVTRLRQAGIEIWLDSDLVGGWPWWDKILGQLRSCDAVLASVSRASANSQACRAEREYAAKLGKPILPIALEHMPAGLFPADIARLQIIDYTQPDEAAAFRLATAIFALPKPKPLPSPLPPPPGLPQTRFSNLNDRIVAPSLSLEEQLGIMVLLEGALGPTSDQEDRETAAEMLIEMAKRPDLYEAAARKIQALQAQARSAEPGTSQGPSPSFPRPSPPPPSAAPSGPSPQKSARSTDPWPWSQQATSTAPQQSQPTSTGPQQSQSRQTGESHGSGQGQRSRPRQTESRTGHARRQGSEHAGVARERRLARNRRPSPEQIDDPVSRAVRAAVRPGLLTFNPPAEMIQGRSERVEVGIARSVELRESLETGLRGQGKPQFEEVSTSPFMGVELKGTSFEVTSFSPLEQLVAPIARWEFDVRPNRAGHQKLTLCVSLRVDSPVATGGRIAIPVLEREIRIRVDIGFSARRFLASNWQWLIATAVGLGGALVAWITLFRLPFSNRSSIPRSSGLIT
jgi:hypothetical protein